MFSASLREMLCFYLVFPILDTLAHFRHFRHFGIRVNLCPNTLCVLGVSAVNKELGGEVAVAFGAIEVVSHEEKGTCDPHIERGR